MIMYGKYGSYQFDDNAIIVATSVRTMVNKGGQPYSQRYSHKVAGYLSGADQATITQKMSALHTALQRPYQNFVFYQDSGSASATYLLNATSISGVVVTDGPNFTESKGAEYSTQRHFEFTVEAEYPLSGTGNYLLNFSESLHFYGGGPRYIYKEAVLGPPQKQRPCQATTFYAIQTGNAEGYRHYPTIAAPLWPGDLMEAPRVEYTSPERVGNGYQGFKASWAYHFASAIAMVGVPNLWVR